MALIMVGGQAKNIGKTTLVCNIIAAFPGLQWIALKVTTHLHAPHDCELRAQSKGWSLWEQIGSGPETDTARMLEAGAQCSFLLQIERNQLESACSAALKQLAPAARVIIESSRAAECLSPDLFLVLIDSTRSDSKTSIREQLKRADGIVCRERPAELPNSLRDSIVGKPVFAALTNGLDPSLRSMLARVVEQAL
jgi:molybdopterin-guanine dinucleotide biosynthesis protein